MHTHEHDARRNLHIRTLGLNSACANFILEECCEQHSAQGHHQYGQRLNGVRGTYVAGGTVTVAGRPVATAAAIFDRSSKALDETGGGIDGLVLTAPRPITIAASATEERMPVRVTAKCDLGRAMALLPHNGRSPLHQVAWTKIGHKQIRSDRRVLSRARIALTVVLDC